MHRIIFILLNQYLNSMFVNYFNHYIHLLSHPKSNTVFFLNNIWLSGTISYYLLCHSVQEVTNIKISIKFIHFYFRFLPPPRFDFEFLLKKEPMACKTLPIEPNILDVKDGFSRGEYILCVGGLLFLCLGNFLLFPFPILSLLRPDVGLAEITTRI